MKTEDFFIQSPLGHKAANSHKKKTRLIMIYRCANTQSQNNDNERY